MQHPSMHIMYEWEGNQEAMEIKEFQEPKGSQQTIQARRMHLSGSAYLPIARANSIDERETNTPMIQVCISLCGPVH